jgi:hypothetical protein
MKRNIPVFFSLFLLLFYSCSKEEEATITPETRNHGELAFVKTFGGSKNEIAKSVVKTADGGYLIAGYTQSTDGDLAGKINQDFDFLLLKFSSEDVLQWSKTFGGSLDDQANDVIHTQDGGFAILGFAESTDKDLTENAGSRDFWLVKLNNAGNLLWQKSFGFSGLDYGTSLIETNDNGFLISGVLDVTASGGLGNKSASNKHAGGDIWALKINAEGTVVWQNYFGGSYTDTPYGIVKTSDNGFILACSSDSNDVDISDHKGAYDFWLIKMSSEGTLLWEKSFGGSEIDEARAITPTSDGNFLIVGDTRSNDLDVSVNKGAADLWMIKITPNGNLLWKKTLGGSSFDVARSVFETQDNGFLISGSSRSLNGDVSQNKGQNDAWILKVDALGTIVWQKTVGGSEIDFGYDAVELNNGTVIAVGETNSSNGDITENKGFSDLLVIKIK